MQQQKSKVLPLPTAPYTPGTLVLANIPEIGKGRAVSMLFIQAQTIDRFTDEVSNFHLDAYISTEPLSLTYMLHSTQVTKPLLLFWV